MKNFAADLLDGRSGFLSVVKTIFFTAAFSKCRDSVGWSFFIVLFTGYEVGSVSQSSFPKCVKYGKISQARLAVHLG